MRIFKHLLLICSLVQLFTNFACASDDKNLDIGCLEIPNKKILKSGWFFFEPYNFNKPTIGGYNLVGMDIDIIKNIAQRVGVNIKYDQVSWEQQHIDLKYGVRDIISGAIYSEARAKYAYFSIPYRYEENSLFMMNNNEKNLNFSSILEFLAQARLQNFILGVQSGAVYSDPQINLFIKDETNRDIILEYSNDIDSLNALIRGEIDGFISDRVVGAAAVLNQKANFLVKEVELNIKSPIHLMFSKKSVPVELVDKFNDEIKAFAASKEYKKIVTTYIYPVILMETIGSQWFYFIGVIGTIAFAISGISIAAKDNSTLFGTFLLAMLPSVGGGIMRDVIINRDEVGILLTPSYMYYIIITVLIGFSVIRLLEYYNKRANEDDIMNKFWDNILMLGDALGQAAFIVTGVSIAIMARLDPIELWGPFFAFLTSNGGGIIRDLIRKERIITCLVGTVNVEVGIIWSLIFSIYLDVNSYDPDPSDIRNMVIIIITGCFITRLMSHYFNVQNIKFRSERIT